MKIDMIRTIKYGFMAAVLGVLLSGCVKEVGIDTPGPGETADEVTITVRIPGQQTPSTRSMDGVAENAVKTIDVLVFDYASSGGVTTETFYKHVRGQVKSVDAPETDRQPYTATFSVGLPTRNNVRLVLLANMVSQSNVDFDFTQFTEGMSKHEVLSSLKVNNIGMWPHDASTETGYKPIPMYGETNAPINISGSYKITGVELRRIFARIDVINETDNFDLQYILLYRPQQEAFVAPNWQLSGNQEGQIKPHNTEPNVPGYDGRPGTGDQYTSGRQYYGFPSPATTSFIGEIYTPESVSAGDYTTGQDWDANATSLILGGIFDGKTTYYRVDFTYPNENPAVNPEYMPLLRNYKYVVTIKEVNGVGHYLSSDAAQSKGMSNNFKATIHSYDEGDLTDFVYNGNYWLGLENSEIRIPAEPSSGGLLYNNFFRTNQDGFSGTKLENVKFTYLDNQQNWIKTSYGATVAPKDNGYEVTTSLNYVSIGGSTPNEHINASDVERRARVEFTAGLLSHSYEIVQEGAPEAELYWKGQTVGTPLILNPKRTYSPAVTEQVYVIVNKKRKTEINYIKLDNGSEYTIPAKEWGEYQQSFTQPNLGIVVPKREFTVYLRATGGENSSYTRTLQMIDVPVYHNGWATSNIYWDPDIDNGDGTFGGMTFSADPGDPNADPSDPTYEHPELYQGLFFKWGSLYGLPGNKLYNLTADCIYSLNGKIAPVGFDAIKQPTPGKNQNNANTPFLRDYQEQPNQGDICKKLSGRPGVPPGKWRMPTGHELAYLADQVTPRPVPVFYMDGTAPTYGDDQAAREGRAVVRKGMRISDPNRPNEKAVYFPYSSYQNTYRFFETSLSYYWSGSKSYHATQEQAPVFYFSPSSGFNFKNVVTYKEYAMPIRCVRDND